MRVAENGVVTFDSSVARAGMRSIRLMISSDNYVEYDKKYHTDRPADHGFQCFLLLGKGSVGWIYTIPGTDIYYKVANGHQALTGTLYGTASLSYEEILCGKMQRAASMIPLHLPQPEKVLFSEMQMYQYLTENG